MIYEEIQLWSDEKLEELGGQNPKVAIYSLSNTNEVDINKKRPCMVICPGGGYAMTSDREAEPVMAEYLKEGYTVAIVRYCVEPVCYPQQLLDVGQAIKYVKNNAEKYQVDVDKFSICGFSAGGHLAAHYSNMWNSPMLSQALDTDSETLRVHAAVLGYPVISGPVQDRDGNIQGTFNNLLGKKNPTLEELNAVSCENLVGEQTPQTYIWHTFEDTVVPVEHSLKYAQALAKKGVLMEMHIFPEGPHGLSVCTDETNNQWIYDGCGTEVTEYNKRWVEESIQWLRRMF